MLLFHCMLWGIGLYMLNLWVYGHLVCIVVVMFSVFFVVCGGCPNSFCGMQAVLYTPMRSSPPELDFWRARAGWMPAPT